MDLYVSAAITYRVFRNSEKLKVKLIHACLLILAFFATVVGEILLPLIVYFALTFCFRIFICAVIFKLLVKVLDLLVKKTLFNCVKNNHIYLG